jgi:hypothetical protein
MARYLVAIYRPSDYDRTKEDMEMYRDVRSLNEEMIAKGIRVFAGGLDTPATARAMRLQPAGKVLVTDGPFAETKEQMGGFWILEAADMEEASEWGRRAAVACRASVEVRPLLAGPPPAYFVK